MKNYSNKESKGKIACSPTWGFTFLHRILKKNTHTHTKKTLLYYNISTLL